VTAPTGADYARDGGGSLTMNIADLRTLGEVTVPGYIRELADALDQIMNELNALDGAWAGLAKDEAQRFNDRWTMCAANLFGTKQHPAEGVLMRVANGILMAAANYERSEQLVADAWLEYNNMLRSLLNGDAPQGGGGENHQPVIDQV